MKMKKLPAKFNFLIKDQDETFRLYVDRSEVGKRVLKSLIKKRDGEDALGNAVNGFYLSSRNKEVGLLSQLYGYNAMLTIMNRYHIDLTEKEKKETIEGVRYVIDYLNDNGGYYDLNPILDTDINNELFADSDNNYIGAMTWALSLFVAARTAHRKGIIVFDEDDMADILKQIRTIVRFFVDNVIEKGGEPLGWGYANGCTEPSLFFTYSVVEAFADFDDNILGGGDLGPDEEAIDAINAVKGGSDEEDYKLTNRYRNLCFKIGDRAWSIFKDTLKNDFFSDNFSPNFKIITEDEILNSSRSSVLFNTLYVIFMMFYSYTNQRNEEESEEIVNSMNLGLQLVQNFYDELRAMGKESIVDRHIIAFDQPHDKIKDFGSILNEESIQASSFLPMLAKANNLIAYYILEFPQQQMRELFDMMLEAQMEGEDEWLWDKRRFDLLSTERYLESIADFFDYYDKYERTYADKSTTDTQRRKEITKEITPGVEQRVQKRLESRHKKEMEEVKRTMESNYPIEVAINSRIDEKVEERAMGMLIETVEKITQYNTATQKQKAAIEETFTESQKKLKEGIEAMFMSYLADDIRVKASSANEMNEKVLADAIKVDMQAFISEFVAFIAHNNVNLPDEKKASLADIFTIILRTKQKQETGEN